MSLLILFPTLLISKQAARPMHSYYQQARFFQSSSNLQNLPPEKGAEVAFAGRSNAGKSSTLNVVSQQKSLARTSKTPGRTQLINFFALPEDRYLVDLPGYGYAKVPNKVKFQWQRFIEAYLTERKTLKGVVLVMDIRHPLKEFDQLMLEWADEEGLPVHVVLNKSDKLKRGAAKSSLLTVQKKLQYLKSPLTIQAFSALKKEGVEELWNVLDGWLLEGLVEGD